VAKFLVLYIAKKTAEQQIEDMKKGRETWINWFKSQGAAIMDPGNPTAKPVALNKKGKTRAHANNVAGYTVIEANNIEAVKVMMRDNPHLDAPKNSVEILETIPIL
jgi:hypothetical protein